MAGIRAAVSNRSGGQLVDRFAVPRLVGRGRALDIIVNAVLPIVHAWAGIQSDRALMGRCLELAEELPPPSENAVTREMRTLLGVPKGRSVVSNAARHQGLIHLYRKHIGRIREQAAPYGAAPPANEARLLVAA